MKEEVFGRIPVDRSIETAKEVMEKSGFWCEMRWNDAFAEFDEKGNQTTHEEMDFLYCGREKTAFPYVCTRRWQIAIVHKRRAVTDVFVSVGLICP